MVTVVLNFYLGMAITFHKIFHGFLSGIGTGNASLKSNMIQQVVAMREEVFYNIFLDLHKSYNILDRYRCLGILAACRVGRNAIHLLWRYWDRLIMLAKDGGCFGTPFKDFRGGHIGIPPIPHYFQLVGVLRDMELDDCGSDDRGGG